MEKEERIKMHKLPVIKKTDTAIKKWTKQWSTSCLNVKWPISSGKVLKIIRRHIIIIVWYCYKPTTMTILSFDKDVAPRWFEYCRWECELVEPLGKTEHFCTLWPNDAAVRCVPRIKAYIRSPQTCRRCDAIWSTQCCRGRIFPKYLTQIYPSS